MVRYRFEDVTEGMILGASLYLPNGELLLAAGYHIKAAYLDHLKQLGYHYLYIQEPGTEEVIPEDLINEHVARELHLSMSKSVEELRTLTLLKDVSKREMEHELDKHKDKFREILMNDGVKKCVHSIIDQIVENPNVIINLTSLKSSDDYLYQHAVNTAIISTAIAKKFSLPREEMEQLAIGALNADIGMIAVPKEILQKGDALTDQEFDVVKEHTAFGYMLLSKVPSFPVTASAVALQHHEQQDGQGYPRGLTGDNKPPYKTLEAVHKIHRFAEIVAVADAYDAIVSPRPYSGSVFPPDKAIESLIKAAGSQLNKAVVEALIEMIPVYPVGAKFRVTECVSLAMVGMRGVVARQNPKNLNRPQILLLYTPKGNKLEVPKLVDMEKVPSLKIEIQL